MKVNAPEKIYMSLAGVLYKGDKQQSNDIEYTRTDTFIEKAYEKLKQLMYDNLMFQGRLERGKAIDAFIEDYKKCIKGE